MFWDKAAGLYDLFETVYNGKVYKGLAIKVAEQIAADDNVLECACGTGMISRHSNYSGTHDQLLPAHYKLRVHAL